MEQQRRTERFNFLDFVREWQANPERDCLEMETSLVCAETKLDCMVKQLEEAILLWIVVFRFLKSSSSMTSTNGECCKRITRGTSRMRDEIWSSSCHVESLVSTLLGFLVIVISPLVSTLLDLIVSYLKQFWFGLIPFALSNDLISKLFLLGVKCYYVENHLWFLARW